MLGEGPISTGVQEWLNENGGEGWYPVHYALIVGIQRINQDGSITTGTMFSAPVSQANYVTDGLLMKAEELAACAQASSERDE